MAAFEVGTFTLGSLIGLVLGALFGHALAIRRGKGLAKHNAAIKFKQIITPALDKLEHGEFKYNDIQQTFESHYQAAITFSAHLKGESLESFKKSLIKYKDWQSITCSGLYDRQDPEYLKVLETNPIDLLKDLLKHANT